MPKKKDRLAAARSILSSLPIVMSNVGPRMREAGGGVSPAQHRILTALAAHPLSARQIAEMKGVTPATTTSLITTLEGRGWVGRDSDPGDRRKTIITITDTGRAALLEAQAIAENAVADMLVGLTDDELARLKDGLDVLGTIGTGAPCTGPHHAKKEAHHS